MGILSDSMIAYAKPLLDDTDGSQEQMQYALHLAQLCWNLALLPEKEQMGVLEQMRPELKMNEEEFSDFCKSVFAPMIQRHRDMFPSRHRVVSKKAVQSIRKEKYPGTGRNDLCPCDSGKKYKKCCGR